MEQQLLEREEQTKQRPARRGGYLLAVILGLIFVVLAIVGISSRFAERRALAKETEAIAMPSVEIIHPKQEPPQQDLALPSSLQAFAESPIYARTSGYLGHWYKDIGSKVRKGELLAEIETPEIDQELSQARATRDQTEAQLKLAQSSAKRWETLQKMDAVSAQESDERTSSYAQGAASLAAANANVRRLEQTESFKRVTAPFAGVLIRRNVDVGALVNAGNGGANQELFVVADVDPIRIYVDVPEVYSGAIHRGVSARIEISALPGQQFTGNVVRTSDAIDPGTRTLRTEIDVPNPNGKLLPGSYAQVHFALKEDVPRLTIPANALLFRAEGPRAAVVGQDNKIQLKTVNIGRDFGTSVEILSGLAAGDSVVLGPSDSLEDGEPVQIAQRKEEQQR